MQGRAGGLYCPVQVGGFWRGAGAGQTNHVISQLAHSEE